MDKISLDYKRKSYLPDCKLKFMPAGQIIFSAIKLYHNIKLFQDEYVPTERERIKWLDCPVIVRTANEGIPGDIIIK